MIQGTILLLFRWQLITLGQLKIHRFLIMIILIFWHRAMDFYNSIKVLERWPVEMQSRWETIPKLFTFSINKKQITQAE